MNNKKAAAIAYEQNSAKILASGINEEAFLIISKAKEFNIPIFQNKQLVESLLKNSINDELDAETCEIVAKIMLWLNKKETQMQLS